MQHSIQIVLINHLDENVGSMIHKFEDDTKIAGTVDSEKACLKLQALQHTDRLGNCPRDRQTNVTPISVKWCILVS